MLNRNLTNRAGQNLQRLVDRFGQREHLKGVAVYNTNGSHSPLHPASLPYSSFVRARPLRRAARCGYGSSYA